MRSPLQWSLWPLATLIPWQYSTILHSEPCISATAYSLCLIGILLKEITRTGAPRGNGFGAFVLFTCPELSLDNTEAHYSASLSSPHGVQLWTRTHSSQADFLYFPLTIRKHFDKPLLLQLLGFYGIQAFPAHNSLIHSSLCSCFSHAFVNILLSWI